ELRRQGEPEISREAFMAGLRRIPWWQKLNRRRHHYSIMLYREARFCLHTKRYVRALRAFAASLLLNPYFGLATVRKVLTQGVTPSI
ncbi:hypothetical protein SAMN06265337_4352, partial [Hymenobacter gelipurpurascens]